MEIISLIGRTVGAFMVYLTMEKIESHFINWRKIAVSTGKEE